MIKANRNQLANVNNPFQGDAWKVLCICSAGLLRSPTAANALHKKFGYNTRACGSSHTFALIPITEALIAWADELLFVNKENFDELDSEEKELIEKFGKFTTVLNIPDDYDFGSKMLEEIIVSQYMRQSEAE